MKCQAKHPETGGQCDWPMRHGNLHLLFDFERGEYLEWAEEAPAPLRCLTRSTREWNAVSEAEDKAAYDWAHPSDNDGRFWWVR